MTTKTYQLETLTCPSCVDHINKALTSMPGVQDVKVLFSSSKVKVTHADDADTTKTKPVIEKLGYKVISES